MIRALLYCHDTYMAVGDAARASECVEAAVRVLDGLETLFGTGWRYVNTPHYTMARLVMTLEAGNHGAAARARDYVLADLATRNSVNCAPGTLAVCRAGAGESCPNTEQDFASIASECLAHGLLTGSVASFQKAADACRMMTWTQRFFIDRPELYGASIVESLACYDGGYRDAAYHGGMWDLVRMEMLLACAGHAGDGFCGEAARMLFEARMRWSYRPDGLVCGGYQDVPGVTYRNGRWSEIHNYGVFGLYLWRLLQKQGADGMTDSCKESVRNPRISPSRP